MAVRGLRSVAVQLLLDVPPLSANGMVHRALKAVKLLSGRPHVFKLVTHAGLWHSLSWLSQPRPHKRTDAEPRGRCRGPDGHSICGVRWNREVCAYFPGATMYGTTLAIGSSQRMYSSYIDSHTSRIGTECLVWVLWLTSSVGVDVSVPL
jgi:hypothetical protein